MKRWPIGCWVLVLMAIGPASGAEVEAVYPGQESSISRAVFSGNRLWLLTDAGTLSSIEEGGTEPLVADIPEPAFDLWLQDGAPAVLTGARGGGGDWTLRRWIRGGWETQARIRAGHDHLVAGGSYRGSATILTTNRLIDIVGHHRKVVPVSWASDWRLGGIASILVTPRSVLVGINNGEWGGGLRRVDRRTGTVSVIDSQLSGAQCAGAPSPECEPVNAIAAEPGKKGCAVLAVGLIHLLTRGGIFEVCGNTVRTLYTKRVAWDPLGKGNTLGTRTDSGSTLPFFGTSIVGQDLWAVGLDGIYKLEADGGATLTPLPTFQRVGRVSVSFALPPVVLVLTDVNQRRSLSGSVPLMVPRSSVQ